VAVRRRRFALPTFGRRDVSRTTTAARELRVVVAASQRILLGYLWTIVTGDGGNGRDRRLGGSDVTLGRFELWFGVPRGR
jgi:hypothetical protein